MSNTSIQAARTALATIVTAGGVTCYEYESPDLPTQLAAELALADFDTQMSPDQRIVFTRIGFVLRVYQPMSGNWNQAQAYLDASIASILQAIGADRTLGGDVVNTDISGASMLVERWANGAQCLLCEMRVDITPFAGQ